MNAKQTRGQDLLGRLPSLGVLWALALLGVAGLSLIGCTTVETGFSENDEEGTKAWQRVTLAPFGKVDESVLKWSYFLDQDGENEAQWQIMMGQESSGLDNTEQITALQVIKDLVAQLSAARTGVTP